MVEHSWNMCDCAFNKLIKIVWTIEARQGETERMCNVMNKIDADNIYHLKEYSCGTEWLDLLFIDAFEFFSKFIRIRMMREMQLIPVYLVYFFSISISLCVSVSSIPFHSVLFESIWNAFLVTGLNNIIPFGMESKCRSQWQMVRFLQWTIYWVNKKSTII